MAQSNLENTIELLGLARQANEALLELQAFVRTATMPGSDGRRMDLEDIAQVAKLMPERVAVIVREVLDDRMRARDTKLGGRK